MTPVHWVFYVVGVVTAFLLLGFASPRRFQVKARRRLAAKPERVWPYLTEPRRFAQWYPFVVSCEPLEENAIRVGARRHMRLDRHGQPGDREEVLAELEPMRFVSFEHSRERWGERRALWRDGRLELRLEPAEDGSVVTGSFWFDGVGYLGRMFSLLFLRKRHETELRQALANLEKRLVEEGS